MTPLKFLLIGMGTGDPDHLTLQAIKAMNSVDLILIPKKDTKEDLAKLRKEICKFALQRPVPIELFDMPVRDVTHSNYGESVNDWHDAVAESWSKAIAQHPDTKSIALLVWGDPSLYDSTLRIVSRLDPTPLTQVIPGITAVQALTAAHAIPLNEIGAPFLVTTGRRLREEGWPEAVETLVVMLDGQCSFQVLDSEGISIWWGANLGLEEEIILSGSLSDTGPKIVTARNRLKQTANWVMDVYILKRSAG